MSDVESNQGKRCTLMASTLVTLWLGAAALGPVTNALGQTSGLQLVLQTPWHSMP